MICEHLQHEEAKKADESSREDQRDCGPLCSFLWWEVVGDRFEQCIIISDATIRSLSCAFIEIDLEST